MLTLLSQKHTPETLPYHVVVPSLPGYALSDMAVDKLVDVDLHDASRIVNQLMTTLGFTRYVAHGGDVGALMAPTMAATHPECAAVHGKACRQTPCCAPSADRTSQLPPSHAPQGRRPRKVDRG